MTLLLSEARKKAASDSYNRITSLFLILTVLGVLIYSGLTRYELINKTQADSQKMPQGATAQAQKQDPVIVESDYVCYLNKHSKPLTNAERIEAEDIQK